jgi:hypothetical protein
MKWWKLKYNKKWGNKIPNNRNKIITKKIKVHENKDRWEINK